MMSGAATTPAQINASDGVLAWLKARYLEDPYPVQRDGTNSRMVPIPFRDFADRLLHLGADVQSAVQACVSAGWVEITEAVIFLADGPDACWYPLRRFGLPPGHHRIVCIISTIFEYSMELDDRTPPLDQALSLGKLLSAAESAELKGMEARVVTLIAEQGGRVKIADADTLCSGDALSAFKRAKPKLKKLGWELSQRDNQLCAKRLPPGVRK